MSISVNCPKCNTLHNLGDEFSGKKIKCKECAEIINVPVLAAYEDYAQSSSPYPPPADYPQFPTSEEYRYQDEQDPGMRMLFPIGRSGLAIAAGYFGLFSLIFITAPFAILFGFLAINDIKKHPEKHGLGRAYFGIIMGFLSILGFILILLLKQ